jgi:hypothetical protein
MHYYGPIHSTSRSVRASGRLHEVSDKSRKYHNNAVATAAQTDHSILSATHLLVSFI